LLAAYGVDVLDPKVSLRRVYVLVRHMRPGYSADVRSETSWSVEAHLLASVLDALAGLTYVTLRAAGGKAPVPKPFPRPGRHKPPAPPPRAGGRAPAAARTSWADLAKTLMGDKA
jgi:hypothetical protein